MTIWWDRHILPTENWDRAIEREIDQAKRVLVLWTRNSVGSDWVRKEANFALKAPCKLVQAKFEECELPLAFSLNQFIECDRTFAADTPNSRRLIDWLKSEASVLALPGDKTSRPAASNGQAGESSSANARFGDRLERLLLVSKPSLTPKEGIFHAQLVEDLAHLVFPSRQRIEDCLPKIRARAEAIAGASMPPLDRFLGDQINLGPPPKDAFAKAPLHIDCSASSALGIALSDVAQRNFPGIRYSIAHADNEIQIRNILRNKPEASILANGSYFATSQFRIREEYSPYVPLHPSMDLVYVKCSPNDPRMPTIRRQFILANSSGLEPKRMGFMIEGIKKIDEIESIDAAGINEEMEFGDAIYTWQNFIRELEGFGFRPYKLNAHSTWFSIFLRNDLIGGSEAAHTRRQTVIASLNFALRILGNPLTYLLEHHDFRKVLEDHWTG